MFSFSFIFRLLWRIVIFAIGGVVVYIAIFELYPFADSRLPAYVVLLLFYCLFAYLIIPTLIRLLRFFIKPDHIPLYVVSADGWPSDPVNLALVVRDKEHLKAAMKKAGWYEADPLTFKTALRELVSIIFNKSYPEAPLSKLYLFDRAHDIGFEIPTNLAKSARTRHHVRFWRLDEPVINKSGRIQHTFWRRKLEHFLGVKNEIWIGAATEETHAIDLQWRTGQLTHGGSHDSDRERDYIIQTLKDTHSVSAVQTSRPGKTLRFRGQQFRTIYISDGSIKIAHLK